MSAAHHLASIAAYAVRVAALAVPALLAAGSAVAQEPSRTLVVVVAHPDDEGPIAPILARYAREGVQVYLLVVTDGAQGGANTSIPRGPDLARVRSEEARCATDALGLEPPILLGFPDGKLGDYTGDASLLYRITERLAEQMQRLRPNAVITWGPDGGYGHPDHRIVNTLVTQLQRTSAPGMPEQVYYMNLPAEGIRAMNPQRGAPPLLIPHARYLTVHISFAPEDFVAARRSMLCHASQFSAEAVERVSPVMARVWNGSIPLAPAFEASSGTDLFP